MEVINKNNIKADIVISQELDDHSVESVILHNVIVKQFLYNVQKYYVTENQVKMLITSNKPTTTHTNIEEFAQYYIDYDVKLLFINNQWKLISTKIINK